MSKSSEYEYVIQRLKRIEKAIEEIGLETLIPDTVSEYAEMVSGFHAFNNKVYDVYEKNSKR